MPELALSFVCFCVLPACVFLYVTVVEQMLDLFEESESQQAMREMRDYRLAFAGLAPVGLDLSYNDSR